MLVVDNVGTRVRTLRRARAFTQQELHERSGVAVSTIVAIERGEAEPQIKTLKKLAKALDVRPEHLVLGGEVR